MLSAFRKLFQRASQAPTAARAETSPGWRQRGNDALGRGDLEIAAACYAEGTQPPPGDPVAWLNLAYVRLEQGRHDDARESLRQAGSLFPKDAAELADVWALTGRERQERGEWEAAAAAYRRVVERAPTNEMVWRELGQVNELQGRLADAEDCLLRAVALRADFELALGDLARLLLRMDREADALPWIERLLQIQPHDAQAHVMHAHALWKLWRLDEALNAADKALALGNDAEAMNLRGVVLAHLQRPLEALACHDQALAWAPEGILPLIDSTRPFARLHRYDEGLARVERALSIEPGRVEALINKGSLLMGQLRCREALEVFERDLASHASNPEVAFHRSFLRLLLGEWEDAWSGYEARWQLRHHGTLNRKPGFGIPEWTGESLAGRSILLYAEQGLGDTIQSLRFVQPVAAQAGKVWLRIQKPLRPVVGKLAPNVELLPEGISPPLDLVCPLMSLPAVLGTTVETVPRQVPYLAAPRASVASWRERLGPARGLRVGVVWSGNAQQANDHNRSMPLDALRAAALEGIEFISLQKEVRPSDQPTLDAWPQLRHFGDELHSFGDTAALASLVDVVLAVDTSVAHLAGALGRPLSVVLTYCPDWRWLLEREDSPWYPTAKLYRQEAPGDWGPPLARAMAELPARAGEALSPVPAST